MYPQSGQPDHAAQPEGEEPLLGWLRGLIRERGPITVAEFMGHALYHPSYGYYTTGPNIGPRGDFVTSPEASPAFGRLFARYLAEIDSLLGSPTIFRAIEFGPGRGTLAADLLDDLRSAHPGLYERTRYELIEVSPTLRRWQQERLHTHAALTRWPSAGDLEPGALGAVIANELVDAFPVHVLEKRQGELLEQHVSLDAEGGLVIALRPPSDPRLEAFLIESGLELAEGEQVEVNLEAEGWLASLAAVLERGVVTIVDYGDEAPARYSPARREGTLLGYFGGAVTGSILAHPGRQDLTALVDFSSLQRSARKAGFEVLAMLRQAHFLLGLGLGTSLTPEGMAGHDGVQATLQYRRGLQSLISMEGLGRFHVLLLGKGVTSHQARALSALSYAGF